MERDPFLLAVSMSLQHDTFMIRFKSLSSNSSDTALGVHLCCFSNEFDFHIFLFATEQLQKDVRYIRCAPQERGHREF